jgi:hypothetical protein
MLPYNGRTCDFSVCRTCWNRNCAITELHLFGNYSGDVDKTGRRVKAELHVPQQRLTAGEQHRAIRDSKPARFVDRACAMINKVTHGRFS